MQDILTPSANAGLTVTDYHLKRMIIAPTQWAVCNLPVNLNWQPPIQFNASNKGLVPNNKSGVYSFVVQPGIANHPCCSYLLYIGKAKSQSFQSRYGQYLTEQRAGQLSRRPHVTEMLEKWSGYLWFCYAEIDDNQQIDVVEDMLLEAYLPPTNKDFPAHIGHVLRRFFGN